MLFVLTSWWRGFPGNGILSKIDIGINDREQMQISPLLTGDNIFFLVVSLHFSLLPLLPPQNLQTPRNLAKILDVIFLMFLYRVKLLSHND